MQWIIDLANLGCGIQGKDETSLAIDSVSWKSNVELFFHTEILI